MPAAGSVLEFKKPHLRVLPSRQAQPVTPSRVTSASGSTLCETRPILGTFSEHVLKTRFRRGVELILAPIPVESMREAAGTRQKAAAPPAQSQQRSPVHPLLALKYPDHAPPFPPDSEGDSGGGAASRISSRTAFGAGCGRHTRPQGVAREGHDGLVNDAGSGANQGAIRLLIRRLPHRGRRLTERGNLRGVF